MVILHSQQLLEQLTCLEDRISKWEKLMDSLGIELDREKLMKVITGLASSEAGPMKNKN